MLRLALIAGQRGRNAGIGLQALHRLPKQRDVSSDQVAKDQQVAGNCGRKACRIASEGIADSALI